jgi:ketopantoate reductase
VPVTEARLRSQRARLLIRNRSNELKASMANDLDAGNRVELGWLAGKVVALGRRRRSTRSSSPTGWGGYGSASL